jgi:hypothetical protein
MSNIDDARDTLRRIAANPGHLQFGASRLESEIDIMTKFKKDGRYREAKYVAGFIQRHAQELAADGRGNQDLSVALSTISEFVADIVALPDTGALNARTGGAAVIARRRGPERFPVGSTVVIAALAALEAFRRDWKYHHPIAAEQLKYAGQTSRVVTVEYYHGGDVLYLLESTDGYVWHEQCLDPP